MEQGEVWLEIEGIERRRDGREREIGKGGFPVTMAMEGPRRRENVRKKNVLVGPVFGRCLMGHRSISN